MGTEREEIELRQSQLDGGAALSERHPVGTKYVIEHDGFAGHVIGYYVTDEGQGRRCVATGRHEGCPCVRNKMAERNLT